MGLSFGLNWKKVCIFFDGQTFVCLLLETDTNNGIDEKQIDKFYHNSALDCDNSSIMKKLRTHFFEEENTTTITHV